MNWTQPWRPDDYIVHKDKSDACLLEDIVSISITIEYSHVVAWWYYYLRNNESTGEDPGCIQCVQRN